MNFIGYDSLIFKLFLILGQYGITLSRASKTPHNASLTDMSKCKLTQFGTDYMGSTSTTAGGIRCQMWHTEKPLHKVSEAIADIDFPERSSQLARNYCRNPTKDPRGPWCYTMEPTLIDDDCEVPLCNFGECRISGTGSEYGGSHDTTSSGRKCRSWDKRLKLAVNKTEKFSNNHFSDLSRNKAKNFCRNPDSSSGGPWCWVDAENYDIVEKEYCSVPFCDDKDCLVYSKNASVYSTLTSLNSTFGNITFWIKLWNPADEQIGQARLLFTNLQVPTSAEVIAQEWRAGVEIVISNSGSGQEYPNTDDERDFEESPRILLGSKWTALWVTWGGGFISVGHYGSTKPIFLDEFKKKNTISSMYPEGFFQYGIMGTGVLWSMQFCEDTCELHTTFGVEFLRVWPLLQSNSSHDLQFHLRASHEAIIQLTQTPAVPFPCLLIVIGQHDSTLVMYQEKATSLKEILLDLETKRILNFWTWQEFTISIFGMAIQMFWHREYGREEVFSIEHHSVPTLRWFSIGSENTIAHWTLYCAPTEADAVESPWFPNCVSSSSDSRYEGSQWTTENQIPCIPWISEKIPKNEKQDDIFVDGSALEALNKCRNPTNDPEGPFCYTAMQSESSSVKKQYCPIRKCRSSGTANDYLGTMAVTRSGRICAPWVTEYEERTAPKKNISLRALIARAFISLKVKRENTLKNRMVDISSQRWDEIGLRSRLPREAEFGYTRRTLTQRRVTEIHTQNGIHKLIRYPGSLVSSDSDTSTNTRLDDDLDLLKSDPSDSQRQRISDTISELPEDDDDLFNLKPATFPPKKMSEGTLKSNPGLNRRREISATNLEAPNDDDDDDDDDDFFKLKPATFPPKKSSVVTSKSSPSTTRHPQILTTSSKSPEDDDKDLFEYHPGTFEPYGATKIGSESSEDDYDFFKFKPATFPPKKTTQATSKSTPSTTRHQKIEETTSKAANDDNDDLLKYHSGTFQPYGATKIASESTEDDDDDFFKLKPATFPPKKTSKATSKPTPGTTLHQETWETTSERPDDDDNLLNYHPGSFQPFEVTETTAKSPGPRDISTIGSSLTTTLSPANDTPRKPAPEKFSHTTPRSQSTEGSTTISSEKNNASTPIHKVDPHYLNDTLYPEQSAKNATNYCRNPSRNIAGTWCYTTDPDVPQDLCNVRDCEQPEECIFLVKGHGTGRRLYVLPEYRLEGLHFSLKEWEPDHPDAITFVILSEDDIQSRLILKVGAMNNEKVLLYYETKEEGIKLVKQKTLPHLLYLGRWTGFVMRMDRGEIKLYYEGAPYPLFEWKDPEPAKSFLPVYFYYSSELGNSIGVAFNCDTSTQNYTECHIEQTTTSRFSRILPISIWEKEETPSPHRLVLMLRGEGVVLLPLLMLPSTPGYYALTIGELGQWVYFMKNKLPYVHILHKQDANGPLFTPDTWTNITITFHNTTIQVLRNGTEVFHYIHNLPLLFYLFSLSVDTGGWVTWAANCIPTDIDGAPLDGGWSEWGPWICSASCNGGMGVRKRTCDNPEPNIRGQPCLGPSTSSGHCNMNKCGDVTDVTLALIKRRIQTQHKSIIINEGDEATLSADTEIVSALRNETPTAEINWSRNGIFLEEEEDRVKLEDTAVSISYTVVNDSGVYTQTLHRVDDSHLIFKIITIAVIPTRSELVIRETLPFSVTCHCVVLGYIYSDLKISWILNGKVFKDYGVSTPIAVNVDYIPQANTSHHGEWRCEVVQSDLNFKWTTNVIKVRVLGPPNWRTHLMEDKLTRPIFGWMPSEGFVAFSAFFLTILIIAGIITSTIWYLRFQESLKYKNSQKKEVIDKEESYSDSETEKLIVKKKFK